LLFSYALSIFYLLYRRGLRRNWGGPLNFLKPERGALKKYREKKEGGL
jgi:hypothetical protein